MKLMKCIEVCTKNGNIVSIDLTANNGYDWNTNLIEDGIVKHSLVFPGMDYKVNVTDTKEVLFGVGKFDIMNKSLNDIWWKMFCSEAKQDHSLINGLESFLSKFGMTCSISLDVGYNKLSSSISFGKLTLIEYYIWKSMFSDGMSLLLLYFPDAFLDFKSSRILFEDVCSFDIQTIMFTNNVTLLDNDITRPDCCFIATNDSVKSFDKSTDREIRKAHNLEKMYVNGVFG